MKNIVATINLRAQLPDSLSGKRLDQALAILFSEYSRTLLQTWIRQGCVYVDHQMNQQPKSRVKAGALIQVYGLKQTVTHWDAQNIPLNIVFEDDALLIVNKPAGLVVHPAPGNPDQTLVNALLHHVPQLALLPRAGLIHRLDKNTSGLLIVAKTLEVQTHLIRQLQQRKITREYVAIVEKRLISGGTIHAPIGRHHSQRKKMAITDRGKAAVSHYRVVMRFRHHTWVRVQLETGRTHQIRVHFSHIHAPLVGDVTYGGRLTMPTRINQTLCEQLRLFYKLKRPALHADRLEFVHPCTQKDVRFRIELPEDIDSLIQDLKADLQQSI
jgi:23S rRNA pseudouridine1911/1915/1917 synthase